jgi:hypothetical protein
MYQIRGQVLMLMMMFHFHTTIEEEDSMLFFDYLSTKKNIPTYYY